MSDDPDRFRANVRETLRRPENIARLLHYLASAPENVRHASMQLFVGSTEIAENDGHPLPPLTALIVLQFRGDERRLFEATFPTDADHEDDSAIGE